MSDRALRRRCRALLRELDVRPPLDVRDLCARLARQRGRPIRLVAHPITVPGPFGLWFMTASMDVIFYQRETTRPHQDHIILHEIGHLIADHPSDQPAGDTGPLLRTCYDSAREREAELVATYILQWASILNPLHPSARRPADAAAERIDASLSHHQGWL